MEIVYKNNEIVICQKPAGISVENDGGKKGESLCFLLERELGRPVYPCHRLDHQTEGLAVLALKKAAQEELFAAFAEGLVHKTYYCIALGAPENGVYEAFLFKNAAASQVTVAGQPGPGGLTIRTGFKTLKQAGELSLLEVQLYTGRTHQIRAHLQFLGHPLLGDDKYGNWALNRRYQAKRQALCAAKMRFCLPACSPLSYLNELTLSIKPHFPPAAAKALGLE